MYTHTMGDITILYAVDHQQIPVFSILPSHLLNQQVEHRKNINAEQGMKPLCEVFQTDAPACAPMNLVQLKVVGDAYPGAFSSGVTMLNSASTATLRFVQQDVIDRDDGATIRTMLQDARGLKATHHVVCREGEPYLEVFTEVENGADHPLTLEMLASFCLGGLSPFQSDDGVKKYQVHRFLSTWSAEGRHECRPLEELNLEKSWSGYGARSLRFGQAGSLPVRGWFPFVALEDVEHKVLWGAQLAGPGSWQLEVFRQSDFICLAGGLADRELGHWMKTLQPGESFTTPSAILSCCEGDVQDLTGRLVRFQHLTDPQLPESEQALPIIFNDWCTTWGHPSEENITRVANRLEGMGIRYLVMDDGWFNDQRGMQQGLGDWNVSNVIYPGGFDTLCDRLREKDYIPGIWFELENCTAGSEMYKKTEHMLHRDGHVLEVGPRRFLDFRDPRVHDYLAEKVIGLLKKTGIHYLKTDYNDTIGLGCDGAESLGEGLRQHLEGVQRFYRRVREEIPDLVLEICASGGHRLEPSWMTLGCMGSFSDSHEGFDIPIIAANVQHLIPARRNQVWAVLRREDSRNRIYYSMAATFLGRMCLSGDIHDLSDAQMALVREGIETYTDSREIIKSGTARRYGPSSLSYTHPEGWQAVVRKQLDTQEALVVFHSFRDAPEEVSVPIPAGLSVQRVYAPDHLSINVEHDLLQLRGIQHFNAAVVVLRH